MGESCRGGQGPSWTVMPGGMDPHYAVLIVVINSEYTLKNINNI
jgi:hypothetical protein